MEDLTIQGQKGTYLNPKVTFNASTGVCEIEGESYQEETFEFFTRLLVGMQIGVATEIMLNDKFSIQPELLSQRALPDFGACQ